MVSKMRSGESKATIVVDKIIEMVAEKGIFQA